LNKTFIPALIVFLLLSVPPAAAAEPEPAVTLLFQPLGFLQYGPAAEVEFRLTPALYLSAHVRANGLGLLTHLLTTDGTEFWGVAAGAGLRYLLYPDASPHAWFVGGLVEAGVNGYYGDVGLVTAYHGAAVFMVVAANGGFRWRFGSFLLEAGAYAGISPTLFSQYSYDSYPDITYVGGLPFTFFWTVELSLGVAF
jgi:hypothetical protein